MTTYIVAQSRPSGPVHLSADGEYTLAVVCHQLLRRTPVPRVPPRGRMGGARAAGRHLNHWRLTL